MAKKLSEYTFSFKIKLFSCCFVVLACTASWAICVGSAYATDSLIVTTSLEEADVDAPDSLAAITSGEVIAAAAAPDPAPSSDLVEPDALASESTSDLTLSPAPSNPPLEATGVSTLLKVGKETLYDGTTVYTPLANATYTLADNTLTLIGEDMPTDMSEIDDPSDIPTITTLGNVIARGLGSTFKIYFQKNTMLLDSDDTDDQATIDVIGDVTFAGDDGAQLVVIGSIAARRDDANGAEGDVTLESGGLTVISFSKDATNGSSPASACIDASDDVTFNGGSATILGLGSGPAINAGGDFVQADGGFNQILTLGDAAVNVGGDVVISGGQALFLGLAGSGMNVTGDDTTVTLSGGVMQFLGILDQQNTTDPSCTCGLFIKNGNLIVNGGNHQIVGVGMEDDDKGLFVGNGSGSVRGNVTVNDGTLFVISAMGDGIIAKGAIKVTGGTLDGSGNFAGIHADGDIDISGGAVNAFATGKADASNIDWQAFLDKWQNAKTLEEYLALFADLANLQRSVNNRRGYALSSGGDITIDGGTVTAMAFNTKTSGSGNEMIAIHADGDVAINGGIVVALADTKGEDSTAIGIHAGTTDARSGAPTRSGRIDISGGTVTAYGFGNATRHLSMYVEPDPTNGARPAYIVVAPTLKAAAGTIAPGTRIAASAYNKDTADGFAYAYITDGRLYLDDIYVKWDDMGQDLVEMIVGFDGENGKLKMTREMMQTLVGLDRTVIVISDNVDLIGDTWLDSLGIAALRSMAFCSDMSNFVVYYSAMFKGTGVVFIFQNGLLNNNVSTIHQVDGVDVYDFGTRYDTDPEHAMFLSLVGNRLLHSVHFNYIGEFPATMTLLLTVEANLAGETVSWYWRNMETGELIWIGDYTVDPFGWISVADQTRSYGETAILWPARFVSTGDALPWQLRVLVPLMVAGIIMIALAVICRRRSTESSSARLS